MATVYNWQLKREMEYPYEAALPKRQIAYVFDINKCIGCQTCTIACKTTWTSGKGEEYMFWNNVETKPWGGYPMGWDARLLSLIGVARWSRDGVYQGQTIFESAEAGARVNGWRPEEEDWAHPNLGEDETSGGIQGGAHFTKPHPIFFFYLQRICNHCTYPACLAACPRKAIYKRPEDGIVLIDQERCRGYGECIKACPYKKTMFRPTTGISEKCIACYPLIENGLQPRCVQTCIGKIRLTGFLSRPEDARPDVPMDFLVHLRKVALPLYPQSGTEPNVYYIPPIHTPPEYIRQMFGPGVDEAIEKYKNIMNDKELQGLMLLFGSTDQIIETFRVVGEEAIGYDGKGREIVRVPLQEPQYLRPYFDEVRKVYRHSIT
ncbi:MAG: 4Fe-4S dicluster domain-containing protein [bacterium JZ-2024 1]